MSTKEIFIKGSLDNLKVYYGPEVSLIELKAFLRKKFGQSKFFNDVEYGIKFVDRGLSKEDKWQLRTLLEEINPKLTVDFFYEEEDLPANQMPLAKILPLITKKSYRSGQKIATPGDLVIIGDVNPGAEVIAGGDIIVFGKVVGGILHAGADGDNGAKILALGLQPTQLRIGSIIGRAPDGKHRKSDNAEIAYVEEEKIIIEKFSAR